MSKYAKLMKKVVKATKPPDRFHLSGVQKLSLQDKNAFSLPAGPKFSCPGATKACDGCYAQKKRHMWNNVQKAFARNWKFLLEFEKKNDALGAAQAILEQIKPNATVFRIHESGDFHSQWVIDVWAEVVRQRKDVKFWAYTRSFHLNFTKLTRNKNFTLWASTDKNNLTGAKKFVRRFRKSGVKHAYGPWEHNEKLPDNSFACPVTTKKMALGGACEKCKLCIVKKKTPKNVVFLRH